MKVSWTLWWIVSAVEAVLFVAAAVFLWNREFDAAGVEQTPELKLINLGVLALAFLVPFAIQVIWLVVNLARSRRGRPNVS